MLHSRAHSSTRVCAPLVIHEDLRIDAEVLRVERQQQVHAFPLPAFFARVGNAR